MKSILLMCLFVIIGSQTAWADEIDALKASQDIKNLGNELKLEEAEKYFQNLISSGDDWCVSKGQCHNQERIKKSVEKVLNEVRQCVPSARSCSDENLDKAATEICIAEMKSKCWISKPNDYGHPNSMTKILQKAQERLPTLKYSTSTIPANIAEAYNKCQQEVAWGYTARDKPKDSRIIMYATAGKPKIIGEFKTESDCHEARILAKEKKDLELTNNCVSRFVGKDVVVNLAIAKAMIKYSTGNAVTDEDITFSSLDKCNENISKKKKYKLKIAEYQFDEIEIGPYKSSDKMRFISECKEVKKIICRKDENVGISQVEYFD